MNDQHLVAKLRAAHPEHDTTGFNAFDCIHAFGSGREALLYARLFWPDFVEFRDMVFLNTTVESEDDKRRIEDALDRYERSLVNTEQSFNVVEIPSLFGRRLGDTDEEEDRLLANLIAEVWNCRLRSLFPNRCFETRVLEAEETGGEIAVVFYQKRMLPGK